MKTHLLASLLLLSLSAADQAPEEQYWDLARVRGKIFEESGSGALRLLKGWYEFKRDPDTSLYSRETPTSPGGRWDYENEAADHYGSMVPTAYFVDTPAIAKGGTLHQTLMKSIELCATPSGIPAPYDLRRKVKLNPRPGREAFGTSEWAKDGLIRIVEVLGTDNDWYRELERLTTAIMTWMSRVDLDKEAEPGEVVEIHGNMMQTLGRLYAMSGNEKYLRWAEEIADQYLLVDPIHKIKKVGLTDHGNEVVVGLGEVFALECQLKRPRAKQYQPAMRKLLDRILEIGRDRNGLWYYSVDLETGDKEDVGQLPHAWGFVFFAFENYDRGTGEGRYRAAIAKPVLWLLRNRPIWRHWDNWSDSYESMIVLWKRYPEFPRVFSWLQFMTERHRSCWMEEYGPYSGDHDDGSTARRLALHMNLASQGVRTIPYVERLRLGAFEKNGDLFLHAESDVPWSGRLCFDWPRSEHRAARVDWARINETQEWYTVRPQLRYRLSLDGGAPLTVSGQQLIDGFHLELKPGRSRRIRVSPAAGV